MSTRFISNSSIRELKAQYQLYQLYFLVDFFLTKICIHNTFYLPKWVGVEMNLNKAMVYVSFAAILFFSVWLTWMCFYQEERIVDPINKEIENLVSIQGNNDIVMRPSVNFSDVESGGVKVLQMSVPSAERFFNLAKNETIFVSVYDDSEFKKDHGKSYVFSKTYWTYAQTRDGSTIAVIYTNTQNRPGFTVESHDDSNIYYLRETSFYAVIITAMVGLLVVLIEIIIFKGTVLYVSKKLKKF